MRASAPTTCREINEMTVIVANNAASRLAASITTSSTELSVTAGTGSLFPALSAGQWFPLTLIKADGALEVVKATARNVDVITIQRGFENTQPRAFSSGDRVELRLTASTLAQMLVDFLPFTPVQQGGGAGQTADKVHIGWDGTSLTAQVNNTALGKFWYGTNLNPMPVGGGGFTGKIATAPYNGLMAASDTGSMLEVANGGATGDAGLALMSFVCPGTYGIKLGLRSDGVFGLGGWSSTAYRWYSASNGDMVASGNVAAYSDPRLKEDVSRITGALDIIEQLDGVRFTWNDKTTLIGKPGVRDIGVLADQVEAVLPEIVGRSIPDDGNDGEQWRIVAYDKLVPVLIEAVKELAIRVRSREGL